MSDGIMPMMMYGLSPGYMIIAIVTAVLSGLASMWIKGSFAKYSKMPNTRNMTGAEAAAMMLKAEGITDVQIRRFQGGMLSDHYDPGSKTINLSPEVYDSRSVAAVGVACHEAGHALQHARHYAPLKLRSLLVGPTNLASKAAIPLIFLGLMVAAMDFAGLSVLGMSAAKLGVLLFGVAFVFQLITLPVEINASMRSKAALVNNGIVAPGAEANGVSHVLTAAAFTYIAAAVTSLMSLLYYMSLVNRRRN